MLPNRRGGLINYLKNSIVVTYLFYLRFSWGLLGENINRN